MSIRTLLVALLLVQTLLVGAMTGGLSLWHGNRAVDELAERLTREVALRIDARVAEVLSHPHLANQLNADAVAVGGIDPAGPTEPLEKLTWRHVQRVPITLTYFGLPNGDYIGSRRLPSDRGFTISLANARTGGLNERYATDARGNRTQRIKQSSKIYDSRARPWYQQAVLADGPVWTPIYTDFSSGVLGITAAQPVRGSDGELQAVVATDLLFDHLGAWLRRLEIGRTGQTFLVESDGALVASSTDAPVIVDGQRVAAVDSADARISKVAEQLGGREQIRVDIGERLHYAHVHRFTDVHGLDWRVVVVVPRADFAHHIDANLRWTVLLCLLAMVLAGGLGGLVTAWITEPLRALSDDIQGVASLQLAPRELPATPLEEIGVIQRTVEDMKVGLRAFEKYVPSDVVRLLMRGRTTAKLGVEPRELTIFFSDIAGFTSITEELHEDVLVELMGEYLGQMSHIVLENQGTIDKYIGDAIMAFWNAPEDVEDHGAVAVRVALRCQARLAELRPKWKLRELPEIEARIGLHLGRTLVGNLGSPDRMDYTAIGDSVNLAARLESLCKVYGVEVLMSASVAERVSETFLARELDLVAVKGRAAPTGVFEPLCAHADATDDLRWLVEQYEKALANYRKKNFEVALSTLDAVLKRFPEDRPTQVLHARCKEYRWNPPKRGWDGVYVQTTK